MDKLSMIALTFNFECCDGEEILAELILLTAKEFLEGTVVYTRSRRPPYKAKRLITANPGPSPETRSKQLFLWE